jgi:sugar lactone lactonase YvrE
MIVKPNIREIHPTAGIAGGDILIRGAGFRFIGDIRPRVELGGVDAPLVISSEDFMVAKVPEGAISGDLLIHAGTDSSEAWPFEVAVNIADNLHPVSNPAVDPLGNIYTTFSGSRGQKVPVSIYKVDLNYNVHSFVRDLMNPTGLAFDRTGQLYVSCRNDGSIMRVNSAGLVTPFVEGMGIATGIAFDSQENLYVGDRSGTIFKIAPDRSIFVFATLEPSVAAYHLAFGPQGYLYVTGPTTSSFDCMYRISRNGQVDVFFRGLGRPQGMAFDEDGNLYVAASLSGRKGVVRITPQGKAELVISGTGIVGLAFMGRALLLATSNSLYYLNWTCRGRPLLE